jgi:hypothetical protein
MSPHTVAGELTGCTLDSSSRISLTWHAISSHRKGKMPRETEIPDGTGFNHGFVELGEALGRRRCCALWEFAIRLKPTVTLGLCAHHFAQLPQVIFSQRLTLPHLREPLVQTHQRGKRGVEWSGGERTNPKSKMSGTDSGRSKYDGRKFEFGCLRTRTAGCRLCSTAISRRLDARGQ